MKVSEPRWGEVTIKKQGNAKNKFDNTKSFSIDQTETDYSIENYTEILKIATDLTRSHDFQDVFNALKRVGRELKAGGHNEK